METPRGSNYTKEFVNRFGPGLIAGAADDDPSGIATYSQAGSQFRFALVASHDCHLYRVADRGIYLAVSKDGSRVSIRLRAARSQILLCRGDRLLCRSRLDERLHWALM